jgi:streptogramin lyase
MSVRTRRTRRAGVFAATVRFPTSGPWLLEVVVSRRRFVLGSFAVDVPVTELIRDPFAIAALPDGSLLIGQRDGPLLRADADRAVSVFAPIANVTSVAPSGAATVLATDASGLHRLSLDGTETSPPVALGAEAAVTADTEGSVYAAFYENRVERLGPAGERTVFAGIGEDGYAGDGGPATLAALSHPHDVAVGPGGDIFIADSGNGRIRRVDRSTGVITTFTDAVGPPIALAFAPDGSLYSVGLARGTTPPAIWRTTADGSTIVAEGPANDVTVGPDGTVYVNQWEQKRIARIDQRTHLIRTILRGR